jgi:hypothetical protein
MVRKYTFLSSCPAYALGLDGTKSEFYRYHLYKYTPFPPISLPGSSIILKYQGFP